ERISRATAWFHIALERRGPQKRDALPGRRLLERWRNGRRWRVGGRQRGVAGLRVRYRSRARSCRRGAPRETKREGERNEPHPPTPSPPAERGRPQPARERITRSCGLPLSTSGEGVGG